MNNQEAFDQSFAEFLKEFPNFANKGEQFIEGIKWIAEWWFLRGAKYAAEECLAIEKEESNKTREQFQEAVLQAVAIAHQRGRL